MSTASLEHAVDVPVLIVGGGPVGVTLAMDLAWRGVRSIVLEARRDLPPNPRCNTTNARSMEVFRRLGCADAVRCAGLPIDHNTDIVYMTTMSGEELVRFERPTALDVRNGTARGLGADWPTPEPQHYISQLYLEPVLRGHAATRYGIELQAGHEMLSFEQDDTHVIAVARDIDTGLETTYRARYLVGADGSNSVVRRNIGARLEGIPALSNTCSLFIQAPALTAKYRAHPGWMYRFLGGAVAVAIDGKDEWLVHVAVPAGAHLDTFDPEEAIFAAIGERFDYTVINVARWTARAMVANKFREDRVFLAGDAAHIWIPLGGFGMNAGIGDAVSLGWLLAGVLQGWLDPKALDAFQLERAALGERVAAQAAKWMRDLNPLTRPDAEHERLLRASEAARRDLGARIATVNRNEFQNLGMQFGSCYERSPIIVYDGTEAPPFQLDTYTESSWPGARAPHVWRVAGTRSLYDEFGHAFTLLRIGPNPPTGERVIAEANRRGIPLKLVDVPDATAFDQYEGYGLVLVRTDQHIVWRSRADAAYPSAIWDRVTGKLIPDAMVSAYRATPLDGASVVTGGLVWVDDRLIYSHIDHASLGAFDPATRKHAVYALLAAPASGLAVLDDGSIVLASPSDAKLYSCREGRVAEYADLRALTSGSLRYVAVDAAGDVYVYSEPKGPGRGTGQLILVRPDKTMQVALDDIDSCSGVGVTADGKTLLLSMGPSGRVMQSRIDARGRLTGVRPYFSLPASVCAGDFVVNHAGSIWLCVSGRESGVWHFDSAGRLTARIDTPSGKPLNCVASPGEGAVYVAGVDTRADSSSVPWLARADL